MLTADVWPIFIVILGPLTSLGLASFGENGSLLKTKRNFSSKQVDKKNISDYYRVNSNTIIRTQDSRALGAKYLNETELSTNEDCLYWCFETKNCNVAVYKEKDKKSCYLFDCGSHNDFRCMFTQHTFYTSSILHSNHHSHDLSEWGIQEKHEHDLSHLHLMSTMKPLGILPSNSHPTYHPEIAEATTKLDTSTTSKSQEIPRPLQEIQCRHYQFRCLNSSDCIAIYNVCDGIPQCPDGSDESSDLHCPNSDGLLKPNTYTVQDSLPSHQKENHLSHLATPAPVMTDYEQLHSNIGKIVNPVNDAYPSTRDNPQWDQNYQNEHEEPTNRHQLQQSHDLQHPFSHKHSNFVAANNNNYHHAPYPNGRNQWQDYYDSYNANAPPPPPQPDYQEYANNYQGSNGRYQKISHGSENTHYHAHQENGYYPSGMEPPNYNEHIRPDDTVMHNKPIFAEGQPYQQNQWADSSHSQYRPSHPDNNIPSYLPKQPQGVYNTNPQPQPLPHNHQPAFDVSDGVQKLQSVHSQYQLSNAEYQEADPNLYQPMIEIPVHSSALPAQANDHLPPAFDAMKRKPETGNGVYTEKEHSSNRQIDIPNVSMTSVELQESIVKHAEESNSAVLALTLGLCVTAVLLILVGCRMRSIRRRLARRKRSALVHDADYLVNGMYL